MRLQQSFLATALLSFSSFVSASPLEERQVIPGLLENLLGGTLNPVSQLISDVLGGSISAIDNTVTTKPWTCSFSLFKPDQCCICKSLPFYSIGIANDNKGGTCPPNSRGTLCRRILRATIMLVQPSAWDFMTPGPGTQHRHGAVRMVPC